MSPLSNNMPDPTFPPIPPATPAPQQTGTGGGTFADLGHTQPLEDQPVTLVAEDHMATVPDGADPLVEIPEDPGTPPADTTDTETTLGDQKS